MHPRLVKHSTALLAGVVFVLFLAYFSWTSTTLPLGAGPDYKAQNDGAAFILDHGRLAVLPDDEELLSFTAHGGTRVLRPQLSYIVSALTAAAFPHDTYAERFKAFRRGSALFAAASVALVFYGVTVFFGSAWFGFTGALLAGLMPQFTFLASYNNDDAAAVFAATLVLLATILIHRRGFSLRRVSLLGLGTGLAMLAKFSAWLLLPFAWGYILLLACLRLTARQWLRYGVVAALLFVLGGGWWIGFNIYHYGSDDPFALRISQEMTDKHRRLPPQAAYGYAARKIGFRELLLGNRDNFVGESFKSTVGNLDWLRLRMGGFQYGLYGAFFGIALLYYLFRVAEFFWLRGRMRGDNLLTFCLESLLAAALVFQILMYTWTNIHNDIQVQGKYLLPVLLALWLLALGGLQRLAEAAGRWLTRHGVDQQRLTPRLLGRTALVGAGLLAVIAHAHALVVYVVPFYQPPPYEVRLGEFRSIDLAGLEPGARHGVDLVAGPSRMELKSSMDDPWVEFDGGELCRALQGNDILHFSITSDQRTLLQIFVDQGRGFQEQDSVRLTVEAGSHEYYLPVSTTGCRRYRIDPGTGVGRMVLERLTIADLGIRPIR